MNSLPAILSLRSPRLISINISMIVAIGKMEAKVKTFSRLIPTFKISFSNPASGKTNAQLTIQT